MVRRIKVWKVLELFLERQDLLLWRVSVLVEGHFRDVRVRLGPSLVAVSET
jgi:hypothetical protein